MEAAPWTWPQPVPRTITPGPAHPASPQTMRFQLPADTCAPAYARRALATQLDAWNLRPLRDVSLLLLSELATNAVRHAGTGFEIELAVTPEGGLRVRVTDHGDGAKSYVPRAVPLGAEGGRGLFLVDELASRWGTIQEKQGSTVWFEVDAPAPGRTRNSR